MHTNYPLDGWQCWLCSQNIYLAILKIRWKKLGKNQKNFLPCNGWMPDVVCLDADMFSQHAEEAEDEEVEDSDALNVEDTEINNQSVAGSSTIVSPSRRITENRNCSFSPLPGRLFSQPNITCCVLSLVA